MAEVRAPDRLAGARRRAGRRQELPDRRPATRAGDQRRGGRDAPQHRVLRSRSRLPGTLPGPHRPPDAEDLRSAVAANSIRTGWRSPSPARPRLRVERPRTSGRQTARRRRSRHRGNAPPAPAAVARTGRGGRRLAHHAPARRRARMRRTPSSGLRRVDRGEEAASLIVERPAIGEEVDVWTGRQSGHEPGRVGHLLGEDPSRLVDDGEMAQFVVRPPARDQTSRRAGPARANHRAGRDGGRPDARFRSPRRRRTRPARAQWRRIAGRVRPPSAPLPSGTTATIHRQHRPGRNPGAYRPTGGRIRRAPQPRPATRSGSGTMAVTPVHRHRRAGGGNKADPRSRGSVPPASVPAPTLVGRDRHCSSLRTA